MWTSIAIFAFAAVSSRDQGKTVVWAALGACFGIFLFFRGFKMLQLKRLTENTPTSKVRSASMGLVELTGMPVGPQTIPAGITGDDCFYYRATAWDRVQSGKSSSWKRVAEESLFVPFFLQDDTGRMLVNAQGADMDVRRNFKEEFGSSLFGNGDLPEGPVADFLLRHALAGKHVRLEEYCIKPEYPIFVLGTLGENNTRWSDLPERHIAGASFSLTLRTNAWGVGDGLQQMIGGSAREQTGTTPASSPVVSRVKSAMPTPQPVLSSAAQQTSSWSSVSMDEVHFPVGPATVSVRTQRAVMPAAPSFNRAPQVATSQDARPVATSFPDTAPPDPSPAGGYDLNASVAVGKRRHGRSLYHLLRKPT